MLSQGRGLVAILLTLLGISFVTFSLPRLMPGDPMSALGGERALPGPVQAQLRAELGLDAPLPVQYARYVAHVLHGNLGTSFISGRPVLEELVARLPPTLELALAALLIGVPLGLLGGYAAARWRLADVPLSALAITLYSTPIFLIGFALILLVSVRWELAPVAGRIGIAFDIPPVTGFLLIDTVLTGNGAAFVSALRHLALPALTAATIPFAVVLRMTRAATRNELGQDYVRSARAKGGSVGRAFAHARRAAWVPAIAVSTVVLSQLVGGAVLTEYVFGWPGVGRWIVEATQRRDWAVLQGAGLVIAGAVVLLNAAAEWLQRRADPRLGSHRSA